MSPSGVETSPWLAADDGGQFVPPLALGPQTGVVVVGGGLMGVSTAYWLARFGADVVLAEVDRLAGMASGRNAGLMLPGRTPLEDPELVQAVLSEEGIDAEWDTPGHLALAGSVAIWEKILDEAARRAGSPRPVLALDRAACEDLLGLRVHERFLGGRWFAGGGVAHPLRLVHGLAAAASRRGAVVAPQTAVFQVSPAAMGYDVHTSRGHIRTQQLVWACGAAFRYFRPEFEPLITLARGQVLATSQLVRCFRPGMAVDWGTVYWRQTADGSIILGGCRHLDLDGETGPGQRLNTRIQKALTEFLPESFPGFPSFQVCHRWAGIMDYTPDGRPLIGRVPDASGQWVIAGFGGHGLPPALGAGRALAEALTTGRTPTELNPYDPARFRKELPSC